MNSSAHAFVSKLLRNAFLLLAISSLFVFTSCDKDNDNNDQYDRIQPSKAKPTWGPTINPQMQAVIEVLDTIAPTPIQNLTPEQARQQPSFADAYMRVMRNFSIAMPTPNVDTVGRNIPVQGGNIHLRIYTPRTGKASYPVVVYYHGGGWVIATVDTYNSSAQALAEKSDAIVVSVEYRKGPEFKFPTAHKDSYAAYKWAVQNASTFKGDSTKMAVAGESAGGNLAVNVAIMARDSSIRKPLHIVSVYPLANADLTTASKIQYADAKPLSTPAIVWFSDKYLNSTADGMSPLISLINANLAGLPTVTIINAEIDPLQTEGGQLEQRLRAANVSVERKLYTGVTHEFFGMREVVREARDAENYAADRLKQSFGN